MANHKKRPGYHGCKLCKPHKLTGEEKPKYAFIKRQQQLESARAS